MVTGHCACGEVRYRVEGLLRDIVVCHCNECRRWHGAPGPYTCAQRADLSVDGPLVWYVSGGSETGARRGFCSVCGSSLFWDAPNRETVSIAAGTLDSTDQLRVAGDIWTHQAHAWDRPADAGRHPEPEWH